MTNLFGILVCILALLVGFLIGKNLRKQKKDKEEKERKHFKK